MNQTSRRAMTLIEILVATAIVGALMAMVVPTVQMAREAARRTQCQNNLRELGAALLQFESIHGCLPAGRDAQHGWNHSWATAILPQIEQAELFARYDYSRAWNDPANEAVAM